MTLTEEQVKAIFDRQFAIMKPFLKDGELSANEKGELPEPWVGYARSWHQRRELGPHIVNGDFPEHLFRKRAPNQTEAELQWIRDNYKQVTLPVYLDLENTVGRAMHPRNWSIEFAEDEHSQDVMDYSENGIREWGSVFNFMRFAGLRLKMQDAMGVVAVLPTNIAVLEDEYGTQVQDPVAVVDPDLHYFTCEQLWGYEYDRWYLLRLNANSWIQYGNRNEQTGVLLWLVDSENVWRIEQTGKKVEWTFNISLEFRHGVGFAPCINLMGTPAVKQGRLVWESPYLAAKDLLDIALTEEHYLRASIASVMYPVAVMIGDDCDYVDPADNTPCVKGTLRHFLEDGQVNERACPACKGSGSKGRLGPFGKLVINRNPDSAANDAISAHDALAYVSPETGSLEFVSSEAHRNEQKARSILHLNAEAPMAGGDSKTATEAGLNNRAKDAFVKTIADQIFVVHRFVIECIGKIRHGESWEGFSLRPPTNYDLRSDADHLAEIANAKEKGLAPWRVEMLEAEYDASRYADSPETLRMMSVIARADRIKNMSMQMIQAEAATGRVEPWQIHLHHHAVPLYQSLIEDSAFAENDERQQVEKLIERAKADLSKSTKADNPLSKLASTLAGAGKMSVVRKGDSAANGGEPVQDTALNGAQVTSLVEIITNISLGRISKETGQALIRAAFPAMEESLITQMMNGVVKLDPAPPTIAPTPIRASA